MRLTSAEIAAWVSAYLWPLIRIAALFSIAPVLGAHFVPVRVRLGLAVLITLLVAPLIPPTPVVDPLSAEGALITLQQVIIGLAAGLVLRLVFAALELGGQIVATQMGLGFAALMDPQNGVQAPLISVFYNLIATLIFLSLDGHLVLLRLLIESFHTLPIATTGLLPSDLWQLVNWAGQMFTGAVVIALPLISALTIVNLAFGVMTRAAPQLNLFAVGFPISLILGLILLLLSLPTWVPQLSRLLDSAYLTIQDLASEG
jgi:flagellar biosynthetic protein FliR